MTTIAEQPAEKLLYTVEDAAKVLSLSPTWLYERTRRNAIPFRRLGRYVRFTRADLEQIQLGLPMIGREN